MILSDYESNQDTNSSQNNNCADQFEGEKCYGKQKFTGKKKLNKLVLASDFIFEIKG